MQYHDLQRLTCNSMKAVSLSVRRQSCWSAVKGRTAVMAAMAVGSVATKKRSRGTALALCISGSSTRCTTQTGIACQENTLYGTAWHTVPRRLE